MTRISKRHLSLGLKALKMSPGLTGKLYFIRHALARGIHLLIRHELEAAYGATRNGTVDDVLLAALTAASDIEAMDSRELPVRIDISRRPTINLLTPLMDPKTFYGGYRSYIMFAAALQQDGAHVRFVATDNMIGTRESIKSAAQAVYPDTVGTLQSAEMVDAASAIAQPLPVSPQDAFVAFNCAGAHIAHNTLRHIAPGRPFIFYVQDEEGHFHSHDSYRAWKKSTYKLPHIPIYNSAWLEQYFRANHLGPFSQSTPTDSFISFQHALDVGKLPTLESLENRTQRKLIFWARPGPTTARNLFELGLVALRRACAEGMFPAETWRIHAIGTKEYPAINLPNNQKLEFLGRLPLDEYSKALPTYDLGLVLMYTPHPSVPNFELAASGVPTVTTCFQNRTAESMMTACRNLVACEASIDAIVAALKAGKSMALNSAERLANSQFDWPRQWEHTFSKAWMRRFRSILIETHGPETTAALFKEQV